MPVPRESSRDDQLIRLLLGSLPEADAQRLEEDCIVDDELAARLQVLEDDLVDNYARGLLEGERLIQFESVYLASPARRAKVQFARRFLAEVDNVGQERELAPGTVGAGSEARRGWFPWTLAAAAALFLATGTLLVRDVRLRRDMTVTRERLTAAEQRVDAVSGQLADEQRATAAARQALADARVVRPPAAIALLLMPQTRGVDPAPVLAVPAGARDLPLDLRVQATGAAQYSAALKDPASSGIVWRSPTLLSDRARQPAVVPVRVPAGLLKTQHYVLDLFELRDGGMEFVGSYAFEIVRP